jgi:hypothetical protein
MSWSVDAAKGTSENMAATYRSRQQHGEESSRDFTRQSLELVEPDIYLPRRRIVNQSEK